MIQRISPDYGWQILWKVFQPARANAVRLLEEQFCILTGHRQAIAFLYGRSGLYYLLKALNMPGKEVILPSDTCVVVAHAIVLAGYRPIFLDNAPDSRQPSATQFLEAINENTVMLIPTHLYGIPQETRSLFRELKKTRPDIFILQDCAHSFFCKDSEGSIVTKYGDGALFGMNISKLVNTGKGGVLTLNDEMLAHRIRVQIQNEKRTSSFRSRLYVFAAAIAFSMPFSKVLYFLRRKTKLLSGHTDYYEESRIDLPHDFKNQLDVFSAEVGLLSLGQYNRRVRHRQNIAQFYSQTLTKIQSEDILWFPPVLPGATWSHYPILVVPEKRSNIIAALENELESEVGVIVDYSVADLVAYQKLGYPSCVNARKEANQIINLPLTWLEPNLGPQMSFETVRNKIEKSLWRVFKTQKSKLA